MESMQMYKTLDTLSILFIHSKFDSQLCYLDTLLTHLANALKTTHSTYEMLNHILIAI